jgi:peptidyl-prolyl cis-trans isomerase SurA
MFKLSVKMMKMTEKIKKLFIAILLVFFVNTSDAQFYKKLDDKTLVTIGKEKIPVKEFMRVYEKNNTEEEREKPDAIKNYLNLFINFKLKVMEAENLKMDTISSFVNELSGYRKTLSKPYFTDETVIDSLVKQAYEREQYDIRASHILLMVDKYASPEDTLKTYNHIMDIREEILNGKDFSEAAIEYSEDPTAKDQEEVPGKKRFRRGNHGDLGYFTVFDMIYPFENGAYNTPVGEISMPIRTSYGYHIIKVTDKRPAMGIAEVAHIFVSVRPDATKEDSIRKAEKINNIYKKLQEGMDWNKAVKEYSEDKNSAINEGKLPKFNSHRIIPEFVIVIDSLKPGEYSKPFKTVYGWHIVKLYNRKTPGTFEEEKEELTEKVKKDTRSKLSKQAVIDKVKKDYNLKTYEKAKEQVFAAIDTSVLKGFFVVDSLKIAGNEPLVKLGNTIKTQMDFVKYVVKNQKEQNNIDKNIYLNSLFNKFVDEFCLEYKEQNLEKEYPDFAAIMKEYHDGILLFNISDKQVWTKAVEDTMGLKQYYEQNKDKYKWGQRVDATVYYVIKKEDADKVFDIIKNNESDGDIARILSEDSITSVKIKPGKYEEGDNKYIDMVKKEEGLYKATESDVEDLIVFVKIKEILPPEQKTFEQARGLVTADYQDYLEKEWIKQLKEKYPVTINEKVLNKLIENETVKLNN